MTAACIPGYGRTPFTFAGRGALASVRPDDLGAHAIRNLLARTGAQLLKREKGRYALATQCIGGGIGIAMILEAA